MEELERVRDSLLQTNDAIPAKILCLDLAELNDIPAKARQALSLYGHIDILINNGGMSYRGSIEDTMIDVDKQLMLVNYFGQVALTKGET